MRLVRPPGLSIDKPTASLHVALQNCTSPLLQASHFPHGEIGKAVTLSPTSKSSLSPGSTTRPQNSWPITKPFGSPLTQ